MSLLLRGDGKDGRGGQTNRLLPNMKRRVLATGMPRFTTTVTGNRNSSTGALLCDDQIMLQRKIVSPIPSQQQDSDHQLRQQNAQSIGQKQCAVSMEEVMNDLRLLEEQQREAQRKVAIMKLNKQQKEEQLQRLEQNLASLQYTNAQQREQLERCRQLMSVQTRELGAVKLRSSKATSDLKRFDDKLRTGLQILHELSRQQRAMEKKMVQLENYSRILDRLKSEAEKNLQTAKENLNALVHKESLLIKTIQSSKNDVRALSDDINKVRSCSNDLEEDLRIASQMETRTKVNLEMKATEIESEEKRHGQVIGEKQGLLQGWLARKDELQANLLKKREVLGEKRKLLLQLKEKAEKIQQGLFSSSEDAQCKLDTQNLELQLEKEKQCIAEAVHRQDCLKLAIDSMIDEVNDTEGRANANVQIAQARKREIDANFYQEKERTTLYDSICLEVEKEKSDVKKLHLIVAEITEEFQKAQDKALSEHARLTNTFIDAKEQTGVLSSNLRAEITMTDVAKNEHNSILDQISTDNQQMKEKTHEVQKRLRAAQENVSHLVENPDDYNRELLQVDEGHKILLRCTTDESSMLVIEYPTLKQLDFTFDLNKEETVQVERALADLESKCNDRLHLAREDWQRRYNLARQVHFEAIRKSEDEERQNREREEKRRREEEEQRQHRENEEKRRQEEEKLRQNRERDEKRKQKEEEQRLKHEREENLRQEEEKQRQYCEREEKRKQEEEVQRLNREREGYLRQEVEVKRQNRDKEEKHHKNERVGKRRQENGEQRQHCVREEKLMPEEEEGNCYREKERCGQDNEEQLRYYRKNVEKHSRCKRERGEKRRQKEEQRHRSSSSRQSDAERNQVGEVKENPEEKKCNEREYHEERPRQNDKENRRHLKSGERHKKDKHEQAGSDLTRQNHHLHEKKNEKQRSIHGAEGLESKRKVYFRDSDKSDEVERPKKKRKESSSTVVSVNDDKQSSSIRVGVRKISDSELLPHGFIQRAEKRSNHKSSEELDPCKSNLFGSFSPTSSKHGSIDEKALISGNRDDVSLRKLAKEREVNAKTNVETIRQPRASARNASEQNSIDAAPLVEAALTAASQETVRVSQTSAHFRSRHKRSLLPSQPKSKMHDAFGSSDEGFLHFRSPAENKKLNNSKFISAVNKPQRCSDNHQKSRSNDALAASSQLSTKMPKQSKNYAPVRVRKKKHSHKGASQSSIDEDFGFL